MPTYSIRDADYDDIPAVADLAKQFFIETRLSMLGGILDDRMVEDLTADLIYMDDGMVKVGIDNSGRIVGIVSGILIGHMLFAGPKVAQEPMWYVLPDHRNSKLGLKLLKAYEDWARDRGCKHCIVDCLDPSIEGLISKLGYKAMERKFIKEL